MEWLGGQIFAMMQSALRLELAGTGSECIGAGDDAGWPKADIELVVTDVFLWPLTGPREGS